MKREPLNPSWWHQPQTEPTALELLRQAAQAMDAGEPVPMPAARVLVKALQGYLAGTQTDITRALGLRPRKGGAAEQPARLERTKNRDQLIVRLFSALDGADTARADRVARLLNQEPSLSSEISEEELTEAMAELHQLHGTALPTSGRQILRIARGQTVASRRP